MDLGDELEADTTGGPSPALRATSFGRTLHRSDFASVSRQVVDDAATRVFMLEALAVFTKVEVAFPLIQEALAARTGPPDLSALARRREVLPEAAMIDLAIGQRYQQLGLEILEKPASKEAAGGAARANAARSLSANFDYVGARLIQAGVCRVALSSAEKDVGYIPLLHIALCVWYGQHSYSPADASNGFLVKSSQVK